MNIQEAYAQLQQQRGFTTTLDELDEIYFVRDYIEKEGFISHQFGRMICRRISETLGMWINYLHNIVMPAPNNMVNMTESQYFSDEEKENMMDMMTTIMAHISKNNTIGILKSNDQEGKFIDQSVALWKNLQPQFVQIAQKIEAEWSKKSDEKSH